MALPYHIFGNHASRPKYLCQDGKILKPIKYQKPISKDSLTDTSSDFTTNEAIQSRLNTSDFEILYKTALWKKIEEIIDRLANYSISLMYDLTTNITESFNAQINKFAGGKRSNLIQRGGYNKVIIQSTFGFQKGPASYVDIHKRAKTHTITATQLII